MAGVKFHRKFSAAHRLASDPGVCNNIHGHNYEVEITISISGDLERGDGRSR